MSRTSDYLPSGEAVGHLIGEKPKPQKLINRPGYAADASTPLPREEPELYDFFHVEGHVSSLPGGTKIRNFWD